MLSGRGRGGNSKFKFSQRRNRACGQKICFRLGEIMWLLQKMFEKCSFLEENNKEYGIYFQQGGRRPSILHASAPPLWAQRGVLVCLGCALAPKEKKKHKRTEPAQNPPDENPNRTSTRTPWTRTPPGPNHPTRTPPESRSQRFIKTVVFFSVSATI